MGLINNIFLSVVLSLGIFLFVLTIIGPPSRITYNEQRPSLPITSKVYMNDVSFIGWGIETSTTWASELPANDGAVITTNMTDGAHYWATISMFHQLKCLILIRETMVSMLDSWNFVQNLMNDQSTDSTNEAVGHCFNYLRQGILCAADSSYIPGMSNGEADGDILWRTCKDNSVLYDWAIQSEKHYGKP
ncbi:hypothetical protein AOQ84DRAFT_379459 [Glonium stellatum]|uniref:Uncharacterized protein n=1 Tax=Glonium stellatum TaxID=574774 RepID=A0A8E2EVI9_9PEZI|nr:hypothetical protein AOQ84DRAFT_379459 [Glonium stellatum]